MNDIILRINVVGNNEALAGFEAIKKELNETQSLLGKYNKVIKEYETRQAAGIEATKAQTKAYNDAQKMTTTLTSKLEELIVKEGINSNAIIKNTIETQAIVKGKKLEATSISEVVGAYDRLNAEYRLSQKELLDMAAAGVTSGEVFEQAKMKASTLEAKLGDLHRTTGQYGKGANNAYYNTFQLTQVMRELPNFAIDARVGFMSLSNNLPMLADGFKNLANSVDETGKKLGNTKALKIFAQSLLSFNTVMIVGITLMTAFGDDISKWVGKILKGKDSIDDLTTKTDAFKDTLKDNSALINVISKQEELRIVIDKAKEGVISEDVAVKMYNETLGATYGKVTDLNGAHQGYIDNSPNFVKATMNQMAALKILDGVSSQIIENQSARVKNSALKNSKELVAQYKIVYDIAKETDGGLELLAKAISKSGTFGTTATAGVEVLKDATEDLRTSFLRLSLLDNAKVFFKNTKVINENEAAIKSNKKAAEDLIETSKILYKSTESNADKNKVSASQITESFSKLSDFIILASKGWVDSLGEISTQSEQTANDYARAQKTLLKIQYEADKERLQQEERAALQSEETEQGRLNVKENYRQENIILEQKYTNDLYEVNLRLANDLYLLEKGTNEDRIKANKDFLDQKAKEIKAFGERQSEEARQRAEEEVEAEKQKSQDRQTIMAASFQALSQIANSYTDRLMDDIDREYKARIRSLDEQNDYAESALKERFDKGLLSEKAYNKQKDALQRQYESEKEQADREAFEKEKGVKIKQAFMELALGIVRTMSQNAFPLNLILSGILTGTTLVQVANIKKQQYATGGRVTLKNIPTQSNGDNVLATVKTGEVVLNERQQKALGGDATFKAIGVPGFADGGLIRPYSPAPIYSTQSMIKSNNSNLFEQMRNYIDNRINTLRVVVLESEISEAQGNVKAKIERSTLL